MKLKKGDKVVVVSGKDKGKTGDIMRAFPRTGKVLIEGVGMVKRHRRGTAGQTGRIVEHPMPVDASNVMLLDPENKKPTRIGYRVEDGARVRVAKKSKTALK